MKPIPPLSPNEKKFVEHINQTWTREDALTRLKKDLQTAINVELSTIPLYLYTYYSIARRVSYDDKSPDVANSFPNSSWTRWADEAGALLMSVVVEEMLHMSLAGNVLAAMGVQPVLYGNAPKSYPTTLPGHNPFGPDGKVEQIPLGPLSYNQMWGFLEIEYPATADFFPGDGGTDPGSPNWNDHTWNSIGQLYGYVRCIIQSRWICDEDFQVNLQKQIGTDNYAPNCIDTAWPDKSFAYNKPTPAGAPGSATHVAKFANNERDHVGPRGSYMQISNKMDALRALTTICDQGEGAHFSRFDNPSHKEASHYWKYLRIFSAFPEYTQAPQNNQNLPTPPGKPPKNTAVPDDRWKDIVFAAPTNPDGSGLDAGPLAVVKVADALFQYMLILSETIYLIPEGDEQKVFFNRALHQSMIWVLDKIVQAMRAVNLENMQIQPNPGGSGTRLMPTFGWISLGKRQNAFAALCKLAEDCENLNQNADWYTYDISGYVKDIQKLPDVSKFWGGSMPKPPPPATSPTSVQKKYTGTPVFPPTPPPAWALPEGAQHACMGLNSCRNQGRTLQNECAGQGYCSTALAYDPTNPNNGLRSDHTCHVKNNCAGQGGCGLYGTAEEQNNPGANQCQSLGSCATPINAERFSTDGHNRGQSVWHRARTVFQKSSRWKQLCEQNPTLNPEKLPEVPGNASHPNLFVNGPTMEWIADYSGEGMTACGASGMSGAHSCA